MGEWIRRVVVLPDKKIPVLFLQPPSLFYGPNGPFFRGGQNEFSAVCFEDVLALLAHVCRHDKDRRVALHRRHHGEPDTGIT